MSDAARTPGAEATVERIVEWPDTDAAGHYHHSTVIDWVEAAEAQLHEDLDVLHLYGVVPRTMYHAEYFARLWFRDRVMVTLRVAEMGRASIRYEFEVRRGDELAVRGEMKAMQIDQSAGVSVPWPDDIRAKFLPA